MNSHASAPAAKATLCRLSDLSTDVTATGGPGSQAPGHGHQHHPHLAAGLRQHCLYTVHHAARGLQFLQLSQEHRNE